MSILYLILSLFACVAAAFGGAFYKSFVYERNREVAEQEDPRDTQIRDLQAKLKLIATDMRRDRKTAADAEEHIRLAHERIVELVGQIDTLNQTVANQAALKDDSREEIELLTDKLSVANKQLDTLRTRNQELEIELSVVKEPDMLEDLDAGSPAEPEQEDEESALDEVFTPEVDDNSPSLIHALTDEIDRWKRHCQVLGGELKHQRERVPEPVSGEPPAIDELTDIRGIGKTLARKLHQLGIFSFDDLLNLSDEGLSRARDVIPDIDRRMARDNWVEQARLLQSGNHPALVDAPASPAHL